MMKTFWTIMCGFYSVTLIYKLIKLGEWDSVNALWVLATWLAYQNED